MANPLVETDVIERVLGVARGFGDFAEVFVEDRMTSSASLDQGRIEELSNGRDRGAGIRVVVGETTGFAHTADLSEAGLTAAATAAATIARRGGGGVHRVALGTVAEHAFDHVGLNQGVRHGRERIGPFGPAIVL